MACLAAVCALAIGTALAGPVTAALEKALAEGRVTVEEVESIEAEIGLARDLGLPASRFLAKVDEGLAKRVPAPFIIRALEGMRGDYVFARDVLSRRGDMPAPEDVATAGDSLRIGLSRAELEELAALQPDQTSMLATAARMKACLNAIGYSSDLSAALVHQGFQSGSLEPSWTQLFRVIQRTRAAGIADGTVAEAAVRILREGGRPVELLQELGLTGRDMGKAPAGSGN